MPDLIVTNFNRNFTGVSATAAGVVRHQTHRYDMALAGFPLPGCPSPITKSQAIQATRQPPVAHPFAIWHVRRNPEMRAAIWARDVLRCPIKIVFTSAAQRRHSAFPRWLINRMDAIIATTDNAATFVPNVYAVVPHGVDTNAFFPAEDRSAAWAATGYQGKVGIATIGRIRPEKGTDRFVKTMLRLLPEHPNATALIIGRAAQADQSFLDDLKSEIQSAGLQDRIIFTGEIDASALPSLMRALTAVVQLPRYEGYGMTPLEGMASGVPFVASDEGYYRSFSGQGQCGLIAGEADAHEALHALLSDPDRHTAMAAAARSAAEMHYSIVSEVDGIDAVYRKLWERA